jgi:hypothetical protein
MVKMGRNTTTIRVIITHFSAWLNKQKQPTMEEIVPDASVHLKEAVLGQLDIGLDQWFQGRICRKWGELHNDDV